MDNIDYSDLNQLNKDFYEKVGDAFDSSRQYYWDGWDKLLTYISAQGCVLDLACGNARFAHFIDEKTQSDITYIGLDSSQTLLTKAHQLQSKLSHVHMSVQECDILKDGLSAFTNNADLIVTFGFLHHIPTTEDRKTFFAQVARALHPDGVFVATAWQFRDISALVSRAHSVSEDGCDVILDWRRNGHAYRFAHNYSEEEIAALADYAQLRIIDTFYADGKNDKLNKYYLFKKV